MMLTLAALIAAACSGDDDDSGPGGADGPSADLIGNVIVNGSFEAGRDPWISLRPPEWQLSTDKAYSGSASAYLEMRDTAVSETDKIYYLVQEVVPPELPEVLSGNYFVENWVKGTKSQYLQFVVILWADDLTGMPPCPDGNPCPNYQIRYLLAGIDEDPFQIANAKFFYLTKEQPVQGEWVHFERNLVEDFQTLWGGVPKDLTNIRLLFEVRYDKKTAEEGPLKADVYYDDLYLGPAGTAP
ncbi:MAG: hypothetical protein WD904_05100 [Dehalococcoidia bacterium]